MYSFTGQKSAKRAKGVSRPVLRNTISHDDYKVSFILLSQCGVVANAVAMHILYE